MRANRFFFGENHEIEIKIEQIDGDRVAVTCHHPADHTVSLDEAPTQGKPQQQQYLKRVTGTVILEDAYTPDQPIILEMSEAQLLIDSDASNPIHIDWRTEDESSSAL